MCAVNTKSEWGNGIANCFIIYCYYFGFSTHNWIKIDSHSKYLSITKTSRKMEKWPRKIYRTCFGKIHVPYKICINMYFDFRLWYSENILNSCRFKTFVSGSHDKSNTTRAPMKAITTRTKSIHLNQL